MINIIDISKCEKLIRIVDNPKGNIIYIHGFTGNYTNKKFMMEYYKEYNFFSINLPGHGNSKFDSKKEIDFHYFVEVIKSFINELNLTSFILIGHSMGGAISAVISQYFQKQIQLMILEAPANITIINNWDVIELLIPQDLKETEIIYNKLFYKLDSIFPNEKQKERFLMKELDFAKSNIDLKPMLEKDKIIEWMTLATECLKINNVNTIILLGKFDGIVIAEKTCEFFNGLNKDNYKVFIIDNSAHLPIYENRNESFKIIDEAIKSI
ncbi:MAG: alpha/beta hydrolase [Malacoplasma sp.]